MIGLAWQRRVRIAAMRTSVTNSPQSDGDQYEANHLAKCWDELLTTTEKTIVSAILCRSARASNAGRHFKGARAHQLNRNTMPFHSRYMPTQASAMIPIATSPHGHGNTARSLPWGTAVIGALCN